MSIIFVQEGASMDYTSDKNLSAGHGVIQKYLFGVTKFPLFAGMPGSLTIEGVFSVPKATTPGETFQAGDYVLFDEENQLAHPLSGGGDALIGRAVADAAQVDTTVQVKLLF